ncbi:MAG: SET domain-containing protein-lysine N-methyltransferase [Verrucomicrobiae bacterium]|nr:SET domain-containing protein-lysine N-methyltransferase [Verrucomicrobiae bacterium]
MVQASDETQPPIWEIRTSGIHNQGVFAACPIKKGESILQYLGERITHEEADRRGLEREAMLAGTDEGQVYLFTLDDEWVLDGNEEDNPARLINHSCEPNCEAIIYGEGEEAEIWLAAKRNLKAGDELSFDYGFDLESYEGHPCRCGSKSCVGFIVGEDYRSKLKKLLKKKRAAEGEEKASTKGKDKKDKKDKKGKGRDKVKSNDKKNDKAGKDRKKKRK